MHAFLSSDMWNGISGIVGILGLFSIVSALCAWWRSHRLVSDGRIDLTIRKIGKDDVRLCLQNTGEAGCDLISVFYKELDPVLVGGGADAAHSAAGAGGAHLMSAMDEGI